MNPGKLGVWYFTDTKSAADAATFAKRLEQLGYGALWLPEAYGRDPFAHSAWLLANTEKLVLATGIASIYNREAPAAMAAARTLAEQSGGRFMMGLGVSHQVAVEGRGIEYKKPLATMRAYLEGLTRVPYMSTPPAEEPPVLVAALGPKMLELAATKASGAHPYFSTPEHTRQAREIMGPDAMLCVEQKVVRESDPQKARDLARGVAQIYLGLPNYRNNWLRLGMTEADFENGGSDRFIDATFAWGDASRIRERINEHLDAGASHVCIQPVNPNGVFGDPDMTVLEQLIKG
ncbi:MAG: TIGR03620 family F420-dependent LLM class oxidoreductase [Pseudomonadota bacterium]